MPTWYNKAATDALLASHTHTASDVTDLNDAIGAQAEVATINNAFGATGGVPAKPWQSPALVGPELATVGNLYANGAFTGLVTDAVTLSLTGSGASKQTRIIMIPSGDAFYRVAFNYDVTGVVDGWWEITVAWKNTGDGMLVGNPQTVTAPNTKNPKVGRFVLDVEYPAQPNGAFAGLEVKINFWNNVSAGTATVSNVTMRALAGNSRISYWSGQAFGALSFDSAFLRQHFDVNERRWYSSAESFGKLSNSYQYGPILGFNHPFPWAPNQVLPDPSWAQATVANADAKVGGTSEPSYRSGVIETPMRAGNNDQIFVAQPQAGGAYEYLGNVHGGETVNGSVVAKVDAGEGWVTVTSEIDQEGAFPARRFQWTLPTKITCTGDAAAFVNVTHLFTAFADGVTRCDRTSTFTRNTNLSGVFEWMSSYDLASPRLGRMGRGADVTNSIDGFLHAAVPAAPTVTPSSSGGTLAAGTHSYRITARTPLGETLAGPAATGVTTGSTGSNTVTWAAIPNATAYSIYGRTGGFEALLATVGPVTSWVDTGATGGVALQPKEDTGRVAGSRVVLPPIMDDRASWACWYDPISGWAHGNIYDREATLDRTGYGVIGSRAALVSGDGIQKNYNTLLFDAATITVPSGTVWSATHWSMIWRPENPARFHHEIAVRAASLAALNDVYPAT